MRVFATFAIIFSVYGNEQSQTEDPLHKENDPTKVFYSIKSSLICSISASAESVSLKNEFPQPGIQALDSEHSQEFMLFWEINDCK